MEVTFNKEKCLEMLHQGVDIKKLEKVAQKINFDFKTNKVEEIFAGVKLSKKFEDILQEDS